MRLRILIENLNEHSSVSDLFVERHERHSRHLCDQLTQLNKSKMVMIVETKNMICQLLSEIHQMRWIKEVGNFIGFAQMRDEMKETYEFKKVVKRVIGSGKEIDCSCRESISNRVSGCEANLDCVAPVNVFSE